MSCENCGASTDRERRLCRDCAGARSTVGMMVVAGLAGLEGIVAAVIGLGLVGVNPMFLFVTPFVVGLGLGQLVVACGLWAERYWAWGWGILVFVLGGVVDIVVWAFGNGGMEYLIGAGISVLIALYIYSKHERYAPEENANPT